MLMLEGWTKPLGRPRLLPHLETLVDVFVEKRVRKAREVVSYLCKAEMAKRSTQDDTYDRIKRKVKRRSEIAHARSDPETFGSVQLPHAQVT